MAGSHEIIEHEKCVIQHELNNKIKEIVKNFILKYSISVYDEENNKGIIRHVVTRIGYKSNDIMVILVINADELPCKSKLIKNLIEKINNIKSIYININKRSTNIILGEKNIKIFGQEKIESYIDKYKFLVSPLSFLQVNSIQTEVLYQKVMEYANVDNSQVVFDLYCGIGTIGIYLSNKAKKVYGVEMVEQAINDARENAKLNFINNIKFIKGSAKEVANNLFNDGINADVVVLDPPRKGCPEELLSTLINMKPKKIVYVSCNPATLARDLKLLSHNGFEIKEVQPIDIFPHTSHVETVVLLSRVKVNTMF